ncbi:MAG: S53 family peptidase [Trebonia sp.]
MTWAHYFYGAKYSPQITQVNVDGGPLSTSCPTGDTCEAGYAGDIEVDGDIEQDLSVAPDAHIYVYDVPNDETGQTALDEYTAIANQDIAATVSSSWGECEADAGEAFAEAENTVFEQMAMQGQSMFAASGDQGPYTCLVTDGTTRLNVFDPASQPWVISTGGTSLGTFNPATNADPKYPLVGTETAWNPDNLCSDAAPSPGNDEEGGFFWCDFNAGTGGTGGGTGGSSQFWPAPSWQKGLGVINSFSTHGPGSCALATSQATLCREVPDVSANADQYTPYAEYCTGNSSTVDSTCAILADGGGLGTGGGWIKIAGTSMAAPIWASLIADRDAYQGGRAGNIGPLIYGWLASPNYLTYFHDIAKPLPSLEKGVVPPTSNGLFPTTPGFDEATGVGSPNFTAIITGA